MASPGHHATLHLPDEAATTQLARRLGPRLTAGDAVLLSGDLGAGKSFLARALIRAVLNDPEAEVPSPTYTLVQAYATGGTEILHADLYRLSDANEVAETGLPDAMASAICLIEWPDRLGDLTPPDALSLDLAPGPGETSRRLTLSADAPRWRETIDDLARDHAQTA